MRRSFSILITSIMLAKTALADTPLQEFSAYYEASTNGMRGNAERHLIQTGDNAYRLNISLEAKMAGISIGDLEQASEFTLVDDRIQPQNYSYLITGITTENQSISFNWDALLALSVEDEQSWNVDLQSGVLDQLSYQLALARDLQSGPQEVLEYQLIDGPAIESHRYQVLGEEILHTELGPLNSIKLARIREDDSGRQTLIWLATDWNYLLARIEQINPSGLRIELSLQNALLAGEQITALNQ